MNTACDRLTHAQQRLMEKGWLQGTFRHYTYVEGLRKTYDHTGPACLVGALLTDEELDDVTHSFYELPGFQDALDALDLPNLPAAYQWNDAAERTAEQVQDRIETAKIEACQETH